MTSCFAFIFTTEYQCFLYIYLLLLLWIFCLCNLSIFTIRPFSYWFLRVLYIENITIFYWQKKMCKYPNKRQRKIDTEEEKGYFYLYCKKSHFDSFIFSCFHNHFYSMNLDFLCSQTCQYFILLLLLSRVESFSHPVTAKIISNIVFKFFI